jgi:hypothetical protein
MQVGSFLEALDTMCGKRVPVSSVNRVAKQSVPKRGSVGSAYLKIDYGNADPTLTRFGTDCFAAEVTELAALAIANRRN